MNSVIILAAGTGERMGTNKPKQFIKINNKMLIDYSIEIFLEYIDIDEIIVVCNDEWHHKIKNKYNDKIQLVKGGETRTVSSYNGLIHCNKKCKYVLIHDAARPLVTRKLIDDLLNTFNAKNDNIDAVVTASNNKNSIFYNKQNKYLDREQVQIIQTPQAFKYSSIMNVYNQYMEQDIIKRENFTDDLSLLLSLNKNAQYNFYIYDKFNIKITTHDDLNVFRGILNGV